MASRRPLVVVFSQVPGISATIVERIKGINIRNVSVPQNGEPLSAADRATLGQAEVLLACPESLVQHGLLQNLPGLKWCQSTWAGADKMIKSLDKAKPLPGFIMSKNSGQFGPILGEYVLANIIAHERRFKEMWGNQKTATWDREPFMKYRVLSELTLGILGMGDIGGHIATFAKCFGMKVLGYARRVPEAKQRHPQVDEIVGQDGLPDLLGRCDYVCSVLPSTPHTVGMLSGQVLKHCQLKKSVLINVGRGDVIDDESLINALDSGWLSHAVLDVMTQEPLPSTSRLWSHPHVTITPHVSAVSLPSGVADLFVKNYTRYINDEPPLYQLDWVAGY